MTEHCGDEERCCAAHRTSPEVVTGSTIPEGEWGATFGCTPRIPGPLARDEAAKLVRDLAALEGAPTTGSVSWAREECVEALEGFERDALAALDEWSGQRSGGETVMRSGAILELRTLLQRTLHDERTMIRLAAADLMDEIEKNPLTVGVAGSLPVEQFPWGSPAGDVAGELPVKGGKKS